MMDLKFIFLMFVMLNGQQAQSVKTKVCIMLALNSKTFNYTFLTVFKDDHCQSN